ncbi:MAG: hypothetical protein Q7S63_00330 [bacterium]|nr:hypothetical protein [bacterium]
MSTSCLGVNGIENSGIVKAATVLGREKLLSGGCGRQKKNFFPILIINQSARCRPGDLPDKSGPCNQSRPYFLGRLFLSLLTKIPALSRLRAGIISTHTR